MSKTSLPQPQAAVYIGMVQQITVKSVAHLDSRAAHIAALIASSLKGK